MSIALLAALAVQAQVPSPVIDDIIAGYHAWDVTCEPEPAPVRCSTQASDQVTTVWLTRDAAGITARLAARRCPATTSAQTVTITARDIAVGRRRRVPDLYSAMGRLEDAVLRSCGLAWRDEPKVYDWPLLERFLLQTDRIAPR